MIEDFTEEEENFDLSSLPPYYAHKLNGFLREACKQGHMSCVDVLVSRGADVNYIDQNDKTTVLQIAIANGHIPITEYIFNKANEKTRQSAYAYTVEAHRKLAEALDIFKPLKGNGNKDEKKEGKAVLQDGKAGDNGVREEKAEERGDPKTETNHVKEHEGSDVDFQELHVESYKEVNVTFANLMEEMLNPVTPPAEICRGECEEGKRCADLQVDYDGLQADYDDLQKKYIAYKKESEEIISQLNSQISRLNNELKLEKEHNQETEGVLDTLGKEFSIKMKEISYSPLFVKNNPLVDPKDTARKNATTDKGNITPTPTPLSVTPSKFKKEGSQDDIGMLNSGTVEDRVKYRVKRLVRRWEEIADV